MQEERFQPVIKLLASLYKETADEVIFTARTGDAKQAVELAEKAAQARVYGILFNLPSAIMAAKIEMERQQAAVVKMRQAQESGLAAVRRSSGDFSDTSAETYADFIKRTTSTRPIEEEQEGEEA